MSEVKIELYIVLGIYLLRSCHSDKKCNEKKTGELDKVDPSHFFQTILSPSSLMSFFRQNAFGQTLSDKESCTQLRYLILEFQDHVFDPGVCFNRNWTNHQTSFHAMSSLPHI